MRLISSSCPRLRARRYSAAIATALLILTTVLSACASGPGEQMRPGWQATTEAASDARSGGAPVLANTRSPLHNSGNAASGTRTNPEAIPKKTPAQTASDLEPLARQKLPDSDAGKAETLQNNASLEDTIAWLSHANQQNKSIDEMREQLSGDQGVDDESARENQTPQLQSGDYDGDGERDLVLLLPGTCGEGCSAQGPTWSAVVIWGDQTWTQLLDADVRSVEFLPQTDLTGNGLTDISLSVENCGAHTCFKDANIYGVASSAKQKPAPLQLIFDSQNKTNISTENIEIQSDKKRAEIVFSSGTVGSAGAGPFQRQVSITYRWNPKAKQFTQSGEKWEKSNLRLHRFQDALNFLANDEREKAQKTFHQVIADHNLKNLPDALKGDAKLSHQIRSQLAAVARFELIMLAAAQNDSNSFDQIIEKLESDAPKSPATAAAREFARAWEQGGDLKSACESAAAKFPTEPDDSWVLDPIQLGYNAPVKFDASRLCVGY